jgi:hypothetical protein
LTSRKLTIDYQLGAFCLEDLLRKDYQPLIEAVSAAGVKLILTGEKED